MCSCVRPVAEVIAVVGNKWCKAIVGYLVMAFKESSYDAFTLMSCQVYICICFHLCSSQMLSYQSGFQESLFLCPQQKISIYQYI